MGKSLCVTMAFIAGAMAGYMYYDYAVAKTPCKKKGQCVPMMMVPASVVKKAKQMKKEMQNTWDDLF